MSRADGGWRHSLGTSGGIDGDGYCPGEAKQKVLYCTEAIRGIEECKTDANHNRGQLQAFVLD